MGDITELLIELAAAFRHGNTRTLPPVTTAEILERGVQEIRDSRRQEERAMVRAVELQEELADLRTLALGQGQDGSLSSVGAGSESLAILLRCQRGYQDCGRCPALRCCDNRSPEAQSLRDLAEAAGELLVPLPEPGTPVAKLLAANVILRRENENLRRRLERPTSD